MMGVIKGKIGNSGRITGKIKNPESVSEKEIRFANHYEFPTIGNSECLYVAVDEDITYRYDDIKHMYIMLSNTDYDQLNNKPRIEDKELEGELSLEDIGIEPITSAELAAMWN